MKKIISASIIAIIAVTAAVGITNAKTTGEQTQNQKVTTSTTQTCETAPSGQYSTGSTTCTNKTDTTVEQSESQSLIADAVVYKNGRWVKIHTPADTALSMTATLSIMAFAFIGLSAAVVLHKIN